ncbi:hypothetical protein, partial [Shinella sp. JR1-6]|uniref:hypothetical protein n=1 Tax=Shinella sp. JR1-6 TaxID=2527671 RepID=UPI001A9D88D1
PPFGTGSQKFDDLGTLHESPSALVGISRTMRQQSLIVWGSFLHVWSQLKAVAVRIIWAPFCSARLRGSVDVAGIRLSTYHSQKNDDRDAEGVAEAAPPD